MSPEAKAAGLRDLAGEHPFGQNFNVPCEFAVGLDQREMLTYLL
jgi:hypothetical protein